MVVHQQHDSSRLPKLFSVFLFHKLLGGRGISSLPEVVQFTEYLLFFYITADVSAQRCLAHAARQASHVPAHVVHLRCKSNILRFRTKHLRR